MPFIDIEAAAMVRSLREQRGLSPEALADDIREMSRREGWKVGTVDAYTIRRIEGKPDQQQYGLVPRIRVQCVIGLYFGIDHREIWKAERRIRIESAARKPVLA